MMTRDATRRDVMEYAESTARKYASRTNDEPEDIAQRILARVPDDVRSGAAAWDRVVVCVRRAVRDIARFDRRAKRSPNVPVVSAGSGIAETPRISDQRRAELRIDLESCIAREAESVQRLCILLQTMTLAEAADVMRVPRSTLRGWLAGLRDRMEARGMGLD